MSADDPSNPYAPVREAARTSGEMDASDAEPASLWARLGGALLDGVIHLAFTWGVGLSLAALYLDPFPKASNAALPFQLPSETLALLLGLAPTVVQWALIARRGQTLGKMVVGTRIVRADGRPVDFYHGVVLRWIPFMALGVLSVLLTYVSPGAARPVALLAALVSFVDAVFIFLGDRRCFHDLIAGTRVVVA